jgi:PAS domain S-box-containing protein
LKAAFFRTFSQQELTPVNRRLAVFVFVLSLIFQSPGAVFAQDRPPVKIGVLALRGKERCVKDWTPTAEYLARTLPGKSFVVLPLAFDEVNPAVEAGRVDFILANSSFYVEQQRAHGVAAIATMKNYVLGMESTEYGGVIFCRKDRTEIRRLIDLRGKTFMGTSEDSLGGWHAAWRELKEAGIDPYRDFSRLSFGGIHDAVIYAVENGTVDAGTVRTDVLERMASEGKIRLEEFFVLGTHPVEEPGLPFLHSTRAYPEWPMAKLAHIPDTLAEEVAIALIQMPADSDAARAAEYGGWTVPLNYQPVADCLEALRIGPYQDLGSFTLGDVLARYRNTILTITASFAILLTAVILILRLHRKLQVANARLKREMDERALVQSELRRSETKYHSLFESTPDAVMITDQNTFLDCNPATLRMFGFSSTEEFVRQHPGEVSPPRQPDGRDSIEASLGYIEKAIAEGSVFFEWVHKKKDGTVFPAEVMLSRLIVEGRPVTQALVRDVSPRREIEAEREQLISDLQETLKHVKTLKGLLPICASCKKIRDDQGYWDQIESYLQKHTDADFTHSICPECKDKLYPELFGKGS